MKKMMYVWAVAVLCLASCNNKHAETSTETASEMNTEPKELNVTLANLADNKDHVCGMELAEGGIADTAQYDGKIYGFCAAECKAEFVKSADQYLANQ